MIYQYTNVREYLRAFRDQKKSEESGFSNQYICYRLGQKNSRSYFNNVLTGRVRIGAAMVERFIEFLELPRNEANYFRALVNYSQAQDSVEQKRYFRELLSLNRSPGREMDQKAFRYYSEWYHAVVRSMLDIFDIRENDVKVLTNAIVAPVTEKQVKESLELLRELNLAAYNSDGFLKPTDLSVRCGKDVQKDLIRQYQIMNLSLSTEVIANDSVEPQKVSSLTMSISDSALQQIRSRIDQLREEIRTIVQNDTEKADNLYQTNIHLFPLMRKYD